MFNNANQVDAKVKFINDLDMFKNEPENARPDRKSVV